MLESWSIGQAVQKLSSRKKRRLTFGCCDVALDPMTFTSELDLDMVVTYLHVKNKSVGQAVQKSSSEKENETFGCCDLALDPMTFTSELDVDMVVTYLHTKN